jgi:hypothetical protein
VTGVGWVRNDHYIDEIYFNCRGNLAQDEVLDNTVRVTALI